MQNDRVKNRENDSEAEDNRALVRGALMLEDVRRSDSQASQKRGVVTITKTQL